MRRISIASGIRLERPISAIFFRASSCESRAPVQAHKARQPSRRKRFMRRLSLASVLTSLKMQVRLLFFASLKDIVGSRQLQLDLPRGATVDDLLTRLEAKYPRMKEYRPVVLTAVNEEYVDQRTPIQDGDEVAIFPPVSGGEVDA